MSFLNFEIKKICAGWFDAEFISNNKRVEISASDAWGNDSPKYFLQMISDILDNKVNTSYVVFDEEPGTYMVCIEKNDSDYSISILYSEFDDDLWTEAGLRGVLSKDKIKEIMPIDKEIFVESGFSFLAFARTVVRSFEEYSMNQYKETYEENWMDFPSTEFQYLSEQVKKLLSGFDMTFEEAFSNLCEKYGENFNWSLIGFSNQYFVEEAKKEIKPGHLLYGKTMNSVAKSESNDDVMFVMENERYVIIHLTYCKDGEVRYPTFLEFENLIEVMSFIEKEYVENYL
ncbi:hypothetical protein SAMN02745136_05674 [Anaerocolumna jejuensis DSM 15929]|uniref:Uncharacterized protein n=1 Tax=Anaerocolumna jejuensis DSM 15929 TaxID=1121322 RepID=A0A1M7DEI9_9FIRM|nr:hypothetical protein [Anaerocolumna jejuensis]SHL77609.1 hypothetical protein SAMN02745136_05674 [Anaerocolumna jejuensis DSM 15929]